jgi:hypothetical protein
MNELLTGLVGLTLPIAVLGADVPPVPAAAIALAERAGRVTPHREGFQHTGAGNIDVAQPSPDTVVITMTGVAVAGGHPCKDSVAAMDFDLSQGFELSADKSEVKKIKLTVAARVIGVLRSQAKGSGAAEESGCVYVGAGGVEVVAVPVPSHTVAAGENLSVNDSPAPVTVVVAPGTYNLHETFHVAVTHGRTLVCGKAWSAEFAPDPALDPLWITYWEPFHGVVKKDFGFQVTIKVSPE